MRTLGILGGMSWESTQSYYAGINQQVNARLGGLHSAELLIASVDFEPIEKLQHQGNWPALEKALTDRAWKLALAGAEGLVIATNTMHKLASAIEEQVPLELIHIADATAQAILAQGYQKVGLLGTAFTMEEAFYKGRLMELWGLEVIVPDKAQRDEIHRVIYHELCLGKTLAASKAYYLEVIENLAAQGAEGVILGCTEIGLLVQQADTAVPLFDTTAIHIQAAVDWLVS